MGLETSDGLGPARLAHNIHSLTHPHWYRQRFQIFIHSQQHSRLLSNHKLVFSGFSKDKIEDSARDEERWQVMPFTDKRDNLG
ncbi:hypothetical protein HanRHA438_Chr11g0485611 [Helianthus annuus]|nr:hypothetical protein HanRHA438_Chr11g0485611 [Helianthus annuus]